MGWDPNGPGATAQETHDLHEEIMRLRKIEVAARALQFSVYPAHGSGYVITVTGGNINDLEDALSVQIKHE
jgi:hypothetical protein